MMARRVFRIALRIGTGIAVLVIALLLISIAILRTAWFENFVREKIVSVAEQSTGGRAEVGAFSFEWWRLHARLSNFVLHGTEPQSAAPLFRAQTIDVRLKLLAGLKKAVDLEYLAIDHAAANVIVMADGSTNIPQPRVLRKSNKSALETVVDLAIHEFEITNSSAAFAQQNIPFSAHGQDLQTQLYYRSVPRSGYQGELRIGRLRVAQGKNAPLDASLDVPIEIGTDNVDVKNARVATRNSQVILNASVSHMDAPQIAAHAIAHLSLIDVQQTAGLAISPCTKGTLCFADADAQVQISNGSLGDAKLKLTAGSSVINASADTDRNVTFDGTTAAGEIARLFRIDAVPDVTAIWKGTARLGANQLSLSASVSGLNTEMLSRGRHPFYDGSVGGTVALNANLNAPGATGLRARADLKIVPGRRDVPVSGEVRAAYDGASESIELSKSALTLPHSHLQFGGTLGKHLDVELVSTNTNDFIPALAIAGSTPPSKMPVAIAANGKINVKASVDGALSSPRISGDVDALRFAVDSRPFDHLTATFAATGSGVSVLNGMLGRQNMSARFSGSLGLRDWSANERSPLQVGADLQNGDLADALALTGESNIPARGALAATAKIHGTIANPLGSIQIKAANGVAYDQPFDRANLQVDLQDQAIRLSVLDIASKNAHVSATGAYTHARESLLKGDASVHIVTSGLEIATIEALAKQRPELGGAIQLDATAGAHINEASGETQISLIDMKTDLHATGVRDPSRSYGDLTAHIETSGARASVRADSNFTGAAIHIDGSMTLPTTDLAKVASASFENAPFSGEVALRDVSLESAMALGGANYPLTGRAGFTGRVSGTAGNPSGSGQVDLTNASIYGQRIDSMQAGVRVAAEEIDIPNLTASSPAGSLRASVTYRHPRNQYITGDIEVKADSAGIQLARIQALQDRVLGLDGSIKLSIDAAGALDANREITMKKVDGNVSAAGLSYNGKALGGASLSSQTRNGATVLSANSNFGGAQIRANGEARLTGDLPLTATVTIANLRYSALRDFLGGEAIRPEFEALLEGQAALNGPLLKPEELTAKLEIPKLEVTTKAAAATAATIALKNDGSITADYAHSTLQIGKAHITGRAADINIGGSVQFTGSNALNLTIRANADLNLMEQIDRSIHASGAIVVDAGAHGSVSLPAFSGSVQLKNASINIESIPNGLSNANGTIALSGQAANITSLTAESGGGKVTLTGFAARRGGDLRYSVHAHAAHVRTRFEGVSVTNSADLTLGGSFDHGVISGTVTVERVGFNPQSDIGSMLAQITHGTAPSSTGVSSSTTLSSYRLEVRVRTAPDARFETSFAETLEAQADLTLTGTLAQPGMLGHATISQGDMIFFGNEYLVNRGTIAFYNPLEIEPQLNISLQTTVLNINVTLNVTGRMDNLKLSYVSDPPLQFDEIVALLATGKRPTSDPAVVASQAPAPQQSIGEMGASAVVSQAVASPLASRLQRVFGVSQLRIDPTFAGGSALPTARLSLQQRVSSAITFTYSQDLSQANSELIRVEWALTPKVSAVATRDENGIFGVDFFYKIQLR